MTWSRVGWVDDQASAQLPAWLRPVADVLPSITAESLTRFVPENGKGRHSAVLVLFGEGPDLLVIQRPTSMRAHAGQPAFPGGAVDDSDRHAIAAAVREAEEETGLDPASVLVFGTLPDLFIPVTNFVVTPVLAWWRDEGHVTARVPEEVDSVHRVPIADLVDPINRCTVLHPSGFVGPGFQVQGLLIWGFTAGLIAGLLDVMGWSVPWDESRTVPLP